MKQQETKMDYQEFLRSKRRGGNDLGFAPVWVPEFLFPFQKFLVEWSIRKGCSAVFADCGLGKSPMELVWAENVFRKTNKPVLLLTPLAVGPQMVREGEKFGIECKQTRTGKVWKGINVTNYEQLKKFDPKDFSAVIADESGCIKHQDTQTRREVTEFMKHVPYRLLATATPAPNDYMELGSSSEALGVMGRQQMLGMFFTNGGKDTQQWELKGHAAKRFWRWVAGWARAVRKPSDLGFDDTGFILPKLTVNHHKIACSIQPKRGFEWEARTLKDQRKERRATLTQRCEKVAELLSGDDYGVAWCHLNPEGDLLEELIPGAVQVSGSDSEDKKEETLSAFSLGQIRVLVTKPRIGGWGLNWQHCNHMTYFPGFSYEAYYQAVRRCWRFGQERPVGIDLVFSAAERRVLYSMQRKEGQVSKMFQGLVENMSGYQSGSSWDGGKYVVEVPEWLKSIR
jgi:hypothetical protein